MGMTTTRIDHTFCIHSRDLAGRTACRKGMALVGALSSGDLVRMPDGRVFSIVSSFRTEIQVRGRDHKNNIWSEPFWMNATDFVGGSVEIA